MSAGRYGWLSGNIEDLAEAIERVALSNTLNRATDILQEGINSNAELLREYKHARPDMLPQMATYLHQEDSIQTTRMAVAIIANAFVFQTMTYHHLEGFSSKIMVHFLLGLGSVGKIYWI